MKLHKSKRSLRKNSSGMFMIAAAIFVFLIIAVMQGLSSLNMFGGAVRSNLNANAGNMTAGLNNTASVIAATNPTGSTWDYYTGMIWGFVGMIASAVTVVLQVIWNCFTISFYLQSIFPFIPTWFCAIFTTIFYLLLALDIYQMKAGRSLRDYL